ncbi:MAG: hypothetical protein AB7H97_03650 [Pseudobdellovibrionaceae bacterium]
MKGLLIVILITHALAACSSRSVVPNKEEVKLSREPADKDCNSIGSVEGRVSSVKGTVEEAMENLRQDAALKGANYVHIEQAGAMGQAIRGTAYVCP